MKTIYKLLLLFVFLVACSKPTVDNSVSMPVNNEISDLPIGSVQTATPTSLPPLPGWNLMWHDEFDGPVDSSLDPAKWKHAQGGEGWGNKEYEFYTDSLENVALNGAGVLEIRALQVQNPAQSGLRCWYGDCRYTSGRILTSQRFEFTYGRVEARIRLPYGKGIWPAFWMLGADIDTVGWPECGEIDILENLGHQLSTVHANVHGPAYEKIDGRSATFTLPFEKAFKDDFHIFTLEWSPDSLTWYVDGSLYHIVLKAQFTKDSPWVFDHPFFLILNIAVGGNYPGNPDETTTFPQVMQVDYVRVYQRP